MILPYDANTQDGWYFRKGQVSDFLRRVVDYATAAGYLRPNTDRITGERHAYLMSG